MLVSSYGILLVFLFQCLAFCGAKNFNISDIKGTYTFEQAKKTPPTTTLSTWKLGICENLEETEDCPAGLDICGVIKVISDLNMIVANRINIPSSAREEEEDSELRFPYGIYYKGVKYGDEEIGTSVYFLCPRGEKRDKPGNRIDSVYLSNGYLEISFETELACLRDKDALDEGDGESWGWFTWMFIFLVLFLSIYIIGGAWFQYTRGNSIDFQSALREVLENFISLIKGLPGFTKEIVEKFTGNSNRGEYSAV